MMDRHPRYSHYGRGCAHGVDGGAWAQRAQRRCRGAAEDRIIGAGHIGGTLASLW